MADALPAAFSIGDAMTSANGIDIVELLDVAFDFERQPDPVPAALRPERRVPLVLLLVAKSHGAGASWKGLQLLSWVVRDPEHAALMASLREDRDLPDRPVVRFEPALDRAVDLAAGLGLLEQKASRAFRLTDAGKRVVEDLEVSDAFSHEREILALLAGKVTQKEVARVLEWRDA
jgi:hypothetical protein